jgi:hypothetical protein
MQEKYSENIDQLDSFYQDNLREASIEPPAAMWDKIRASYQKEKKSRSLFNRKTLLLALLLLLFVSASGILLFIKKEKADSNPTNDPKFIEEKTAPVFPLENNSLPENNANINTTSKKQRAHSEKNNTSTITDTVKAITPITEPRDPEQAKPDGISTPTETPRKKLNFREKHTQNVVKDSLRPLFVPVK